MKKNCLIVEDEAIARKLIEGYIAQIPGLEVIGSVGTAMEAMPILLEQKVDIMFLDIQMPGLTGIDFLKSLSRKPAVILTTAYSEYALEGYELEVTDYLVKPFEFDRFFKAVSKVLKTTQTVMHSVSSQTSEIVLPTDQDQLFIKADNKILKLKTEEILMIIGKGAYVQIHPKVGKKIMSLQSMNKMEEILPANFYRVHRSSIVNINHVDSIEGHLIHIGGEEVTLSKNKKEEFLKYIDKYNLLK